MPVPIKTTNHQADVLEIDDDLLTASNPGWADFVNDPQASDGHSFRTNDYPAWSMKWEIDPRLFTLGAKYKLQMLVRADKTGKNGNAFYAGVHNDRTRKTLAETKTHISKMKDGYHWYDVAVFNAGKDLYVWAGPGPYNRKKGEKAAVKHVYIDKLKFTKIKK